MIIDNYNDYGNINEKIKIINDLCEKMSIINPKQKLL